MTNVNVSSGAETTEWKFDSDLKRNDWIVTCDSSWGEGYSTASLTPSASGNITSWKENVKF